MSYQQCMEERPFCPLLCCLSLINHWPGVAVIREEWKKLLARITREIIDSLFPWISLEFVQSESEHV